MKLKAIIEQIQHESKIVQGEATRDMTYESHYTYPDESAVRAAFANSVAKLIDVNGWSALSTNFARYNSIGRPKPNGAVEIGNFIQIYLPGPKPQN